MMHTQVEPVASTVVVVVEELTVLGGKREHMINARGISITGVRGTRSRHMSLASVRLEYQQLCMVMGPTVGMGTGSRGVALLAQLSRHQTGAVRNAATGNVVARVGGRRNNRGVRMETVSSAWAHMVQL